MRSIYLNVQEIKGMEAAADRLGLAIDNAMNESDYTYYDCGKYLMSLVEENKDNPEAQELIEKTLIAICGCSFETLKETLKKYMEEQKEYYEAL